MAHRRLIPSGKTILGRRILKPDPKDIENAPLSKRFKTQLRNTQQQLEVFERQALVKQAGAKGRRIRAKRRLADNPFK